MVTIKYSKLQKSVLTLYRDYMKFGVSKPEPLRSSIINYAYKQFRENRNIKRIKMDRIEFLLRQENNKLDTWKQASLSGVQETKRRDIL